MSPSVSYLSDRPTFVILSNSPDAAIDVSIVYVNWNSAAEIGASVATMREATSDLRYEVIVVDNASPEGPGGLENLPGVQFVQSDRNGGFGAGCNLGARYSSGRYLLFLNPDTRLANNVAGCLMSFLDGHPGVGAAGPMILEEDGRVFEAARFLPTLLNEFLAHATLNLRFPDCGWISQPYLARREYLSTREVESVIGACLIVRAELFRALGGFDEKFFLYSEELDLCNRIRQAGFEIWYVHTAKLMHSRQKSTLQLFGSARKVEFQDIRSRLYYFRKNRGPVSAFLWRHMVASLYFLRYLRGRDKLFLEYVEWALSPISITEPRL
jgi:N-acetylglucosaminyl-diphospho-decaprenol L-rhamnosyltransferase